VWWGQTQSAQGWRPCPPTRAHGVFSSQLLVDSPALCLILLVGIERPSGFPDGRGDFEGRETYRGREGRE